MALVSKWVVPEQTVAAAVVRTWEMVARAYMAAAVLHSLGSARYHLVLLHVSPVIYHPSFALETPYFAIARRFLDENV